MGDHPVVQLTVCRVREFLREPEAVFWVFVFPVLLALALGLAFSRRTPDAVRIAVEQGPGSEELETMLRGASDIEVQALDAGEAHSHLRTGRVALVAKAGDTVVFRFDPTRSEGRLARLIVGSALQEAAGREDVWEVREVPMTDVGSRYIDFLIPGLIGMNIMGNSLWGIGFRIVRKRSDRLMKRLLASPMRKSHYLLSHALSRMFFLWFEVGVVLAFGYFAFGVPIRGSLLTLTCVALLGAMSFSGIGLLVASRARTIEGVSGLMNLVMIPMWICSGVFFAYSNFPEAVQPVISALPLTALNDALRAVMLEGAPLTGIVGLLVIVAAWGLGSFGVALKIFRWA
jgi:ABC-type multidrug transport system permease subunit